MVKDAMESVYTCIVSMRGQLIRGQSLNKTCYDYKLVENKQSLPRYPKGKRKIWGMILKGELNL